MVTPPLRSRRMSNSASSPMDGKPFMWTTEIGKLGISHSMTIAHNGANSDLAAIHNAIAEAQKEKSKPTLIRLRTTIGYGSKQQGTHGVHGARKFRTLTATVQISNMRQIST